MPEDLEQDFTEIEEEETKVRESRMALVATEVRSNVVLLYEFLPIEEARAKVKEYDDNAL